MFDPNDFNRSQFLESGAIFAKKDEVWLFWGTPYLSDARPEAVALQCPQFFEKSQAPWTLYPYALQISRDEARGLFTEKEMEVEWKPLSSDGFKEQFQRIQASIADQSVEKVVPYAFEQGKIIGEEPFLETLVARALRVEKGFTYGHWQSKQGEIGVSPEVLISQINEKHFATMALAGTCSIEQWESDPDSFKQDPKEQVEHQKVIEDIVDQLKNFGAVDVHETTVVSTPDLVHLLTPLELKTNSPMRLERLIERLHPTAALGGYPRQKSRRLLQEFEESLPRNRFGAPFAISFSPRSADVIVSIRNLTWDHENFQIGAGCGVIQQSQFEREWKELANKRDSVKKIFGLL